MHTTITHAAQFRDAFRAVGRADQFSYEALGLLFDYFEDNAPDMELDCIAVCCEYTEESIDEIIFNYSIDTTDCSDEDEIEATVISYLENNTTIVGVLSGAIVYQHF